MNKSNSSCYLTVKKHHTLAMSCRGRSSHIEVQWMNCKKKMENTIFDCLQLICSHQEKQVSGENVKFYANKKKKIIKKDLTKYDGKEN